MLLPSIHISLKLGTIRRAAPYSLPDKHGADHDIGGGKPVAEQIRSVTELAFDHVFGCLKIRPPALRQMLRFK